MLALLRANVCVSLGAVTSEFVTAPVGVVFLRYCYLFQWEWSILLALSHSIPTLRVSALPVVHIPALRACDQPILDTAPVPQVVLPSGSGS